MTCKRFISITKEFILQIDIIRNVTWNCSPKNEPNDSNKVESGINQTKRHEELRSCENGGQCFAFELTDVNDNVPFFEKSQYDAYLQENSPPGTRIIQMKAIDYDSPRYAKIQYMIEEERMKQYFSVDENTGIVTSKVVFDYEKYF